MSHRKQNIGCPLRRPASDDRNAWHAYWQTQNQSWRTEPKISLKRQEELRKRRTIVPNIEKGIYPFQGMKLERADVEWLLATHERGRGPVHWSNETEREREGLDVRGADLRQVDLRSLPLTRLRGSLTFAEQLEATEEQLAMAHVLMEKADLRVASLEGAFLSGVSLKGTFLNGAKLEGADLTIAKLEGAFLSRAILDGAFLNEAWLEGADLTMAKLEGTFLSGARLEGAFLSGAKLEGANLERANLEGAFLYLTGLEGANLTEAKLGRANLSEARLERANLRDVTLSGKSRVGPHLADIQWSNINLAVVDWSQMTILGEEDEVRQKKTYNGNMKDKGSHLSGYQTAVRANRQLAVALQTQGLNEEAARFAYRAQRLQRIVLRRQHKVWSYLFSGFLDLIAGYGYKPVRSILAYLLLIGGFALAFYSFGHLKWYEALVVSLTAFHGRGFFSQQYQPGDPQSMIAAIEAVVGLLIEVSFIATFTQRFFGK